MRLNLVRTDRTPVEERVAAVGVVAWSGAVILAYTVAFRERVPYWALVSAVAILAGMVGYLASVLREVTGAVVFLLDEHGRMVRGVDHETWERMKQDPTLTPQEARKVQQ